jgi:hypothetical protein
VAVGAPACSKNKRRYTEQEQEKESGWAEHAGWFIGTARDSSGSLMLPTILPGWAGSPATAKSAK